MKFLFGPIADDGKNVLCVRIIPTHSTFSVSSSFFFSTSAVICIVSLCVYNSVQLTRRKIEKKVLKSRICHFSSTSLHFICALASSTRPSVRVTRVRVFLIRTHSLQRRLLQYLKHSTHWFWAETNYVRATRYYFSSFFQLLLRSSFRIVFSSFFFLFLHPPVIVAVMVVVVVNMV